MNIHNKFWAEFLEIYKSLPVLWNLKNENYSNRVEKAAAYEKLVDKLKEIDPEASRDKVVKKINSMRTCYRRELQKIRQSELEGYEYGEYTPKIWYFELLHFLRDQDSQEEYGSDNSTIIDPLLFKKRAEMGKRLLAAKQRKVSQQFTVRNERPTSTKRKNVSIDEDPWPEEEPVSTRRKNISIDEDPWQEEELALNKKHNISEDEHLWEDDVSRPNKRKNVLIDEELWQEEKEKHPSATTTMRKMTEDNLLQIAAEHLKSTKKQPVRDEADIFSEGWATIYRKLDSEQKIFAKRIIDETLMHAQFGQLTYSCSLNIFDGKD